MTEGWYYLDANKTSQGPFPVSYLQELNKCGYFNDATLFWKEDQDEWKALKDIPTLQAELPPVNTATLPAQQTTAHAASVAKPPTTEAAAAPIDAPESPDERSFIDDDGTRYVWDSSLRKFLPMEEGGEGYTEEDMVFVPDSEPLKPLPAAAKKDKNDEDNDEGALDGDGKDTTKEDNNGVGGLANPDAIAKAVERAKRAREAEQQKNAWYDIKRNTSVYITGLPDDVTEEEIVETFGKCGIIKEDVETGNPKVKIYKDPATGRPKGDGLVTYLKEPSVGLAIQILDGAPLRYGAPANMSVSRAKFEQKGKTFVDKPNLSKKQKKQKLEAQEKALGWRGYDDALKPHQITVIIKNMFHPDDFKTKPTAKQELEADILIEAKKLGVVRTVKIFATNPEGVVSIKFATEESTDTCVAKMNDRWFAGRQLKAEKWDGVTNYNVKVKETEEEQLARLEAFAKELEEVNEEYVS